MKGKLVKLATRTYPNKEVGKPDYEFHSVYMVLNEGVKDQLEAWLSGTLPDYLPYFHSSKEYMGTVQESDMLQVELKGKCGYGEELAFIRDLVDKKAAVVATLQPHFSTFKNKEGVMKSKVVVSFVEGSVKHECDA